MNCPDCGREIKQEKYSGGESYPKYHRAVDCIANLRAKVERLRDLLEQAECPDCSESHLDNYLPTCRWCCKRAIALADGHTQKAKGTP